MLKSFSQLFDADFASHKRAVLLQHVLELMSVGPQVHISGCIDLAIDVSAAGVELACETSLRELFVLRQNEVDGGSGVEGEGDDVGD